MEAKRSVDSSEKPRPNLTRRANLAGLKKTSPAKADRIGSDRFVQIVTQNEYSIIIYDVYVASIEGFGYFDEVVNLALRNNLRKNHAPKMRWFECAV